jgi:hypothetical protein
MIVIIYNFGYIEFWDMVLWGLLAVLIWYGTIIYSHEPFMNKAIKYIEETEKARILSDLEMYWAFKEYYIWFVTVNKELLKQKALINGLEIGEIKYLYARKGDRDMIEKSFKDIYGIEEVIWI